jgi:hypothetical protein
MGQANAESFPMTLIALLLLNSTSWLHTWGPDATIPGDHVRTRAFAPDIRAPNPVSISDDPARGAESADEESGDDERAEPHLGWPKLPRPGRQDDLTSHPRSSPGTFAPSVGSGHLRC